MFKSSGRPEVSTVGTGLLDDVERSGIIPHIRSWDFATFALAVSAADLAAPRGPSADGWTRVIELHVALVDPAPFSANIPLLQEMLRFLTGDFWHLQFTSGGMTAPVTTAPHTYDVDCVSLLSGGVDSLIGAIDFTRKGQRPLFVSQMAKGNSETQLKYAKSLGAADRHVQWNHNIASVGGPLWNAASNPGNLAGANLSSYANALGVANGILGGQIPDPTNGATFFYSGPTPSGFFRSAINSGALVPTSTVGPFTFLSEP